MRTREKSPKKSRNERLIWKKELRKIYGIFNRDVGFAKFDGEFLEERTGFRVIIDYRWSLLTSRRCDADADDKAEFCQ